MYRATVSCRVALACVSALLLIGLQSLGGCAAGTVQAIPAETARVAFQSQCIQNVITCTSSFPTAVIDVQPIHGQTVTQTQTGFIVRQSGFGAYYVKLIGSGSAPGNNATVLEYSWSSGAADADPCTLESGEAFSSEADPLVLLAPGLHYIRLTVTNDNILPRLESFDCGLIGENVPAFDFLEIELDVRR